MKNTILYLPEGEYDLCASVNGRPGERRVCVSASCVPLLQRDLDAKIAASKARQAARPCGYFDHRSGPASYHPLRFEWAPGRGVLLHVEWTQSGKEAVQGRNYSYVSPTFMVDRRNGEVSGLQEGWNERTFQRFAREWMRETTDADGNPYNGEEERKSWSDEERQTYERDVRHIDSLARLKLIFRTQMAIASEYTAWLHGMSEQQRYEYPAWEFFRQPGAITKRPDHVEHEGDIMLKTDYDYWLDRNNPDIGGFGVPWPPFGYNSWMHVAPVDRATCESLGLIHRNDPVQPLPTGADGTPMWGLPSKDLSTQLGTKSIKSLTKEERNELAEWCRQQGVEVSLPNNEGKVNIGMVTEKKGNDGISAAAGCKRHNHCLNGKICACPLPLPADTPSWKSKIRAAFPKSKKTYIVRRIPRKHIQQYGIQTRPGEYFNFLFSHEAVVHIMREHGKEKNKKQISVMKSDFFLLPKIISYPDKFTRSNSKIGRIRGPRFKVFKSINGITYTCIFEYRAGRHGMYPVTLYKKKQRKQK